MMKNAKGTLLINLKMFYTFLVSHVWKNDKFEPLNNFDYNLFSLNDYSSNLFSLQQKLTNWLLKIHTIYIYCLVVVFRLHIIWHIFYLLHFDRYLTTSCTNWEHWFSTRPLEPRGMKVNDILSPLYYVSIRFSIH